jgi:hypothetical protein
MMPTIVRGWPFNVTVRPTISRSPPNLVIHVRWLSTATCGASGAASAAPKVRPMSGGTPRNVNVFGVTRMTLTRSAPASLTMCIDCPFAPATSSKTSLCSM